MGYVFAVAASDALHAHEIAGTGVERHHRDTLSMVCSPDERTAKLHVNMPKMSQGSLIKRASPSYIPADPKRLGGKHVVRCRSRLARRRSWGRDEQYPDLARSSPFAAGHFPAGAAGGHGVCGFGHEPRKST